MKKATLFTPDLFPAPTPENLAKYLGSGSAKPSAPATTHAPAPKSAGGPELKS